ncbi:hypothetical protein C0993_010571, partial [Termitomyces sp. T159_Od127]
MLDPHNFSLKIHNAMINIISGTRQDFDGLATTFNDPTWSRNDMQMTYFRRIENNLYLQPQTLFPDHGFDGWLKTSLLPLDVFTANPLFLGRVIIPSVPENLTYEFLLLDPQIAALATSQWDPLVAGPPIPDLNSLSADSAFGVGSTSVTTDNEHLRSSVRDRLAAVRQSQPGKLNLALDTLATKILLCNSGLTVTAYGVQIAPGAALPVASNFNGKAILNVQNITARHEVIISAGVFQSPQLNAYAFAGTMNSVISQSSSSLPAPDVLTYYDPVLFRGFFRGVPQEVADVHNGLTAVVLKGHPSSKGFVKLTGSHPQDSLNIQKLRFQAAGGPADVAAIREGIKRARKLVALPPISPFVMEEIAPGPNVTTDDEIDNYVYNRIF